jgi:TnpA family transposase
MKNKEVTLLSQFEYEQTYLISKFNDIQRNLYFNLSAEEKQLVDSKKHPHVKLHFILQLGYFKHKQRLFVFTLDEVKDDVAFICSFHLIDSHVKLKLPTRTTITNNNEEILSLMGYLSPEDDGIEMATRKTSELLRAFMCPKLIFSELSNYFSSKKIIMPAYTRLQKTIGNAIATEDRRLAKLIKSNVSKQDSELLQRLFEMNSEGIYNIRDLKVDARNFTYKQLKRHIKRLEDHISLYELSQQLIPKLVISPQKIKYYASLVEYYNTNEMAELKQEKAYLYVFCYVYARLRIIRDHLIEAFKHYVEKYLKEGKEHSDKEHTKKTMEVVADLSHGSKLLRFYNDLSLYEKMFDYVRKKAHQILPYDRINTVCDYLEKKSGERDDYKWAHYASKQKIIAKNLRPLFKAIDFDYGHGAKKLSIAAYFLKSVFSSNKSLSKQSPTRFPREFIPNALKAYVTTPDGVDVSKYEFLVYSQILSKLDKGIVTCDNSTKYRDFDTEIRETIDWDNDKKRVKTIHELDAEELSLPIEQLLGQHECEINELYETVNKDIISGKNKEIKIENSENGIDWRLPYTRRKSEFNNPFYDKLPRVDISTVLDFVDKHTGMLNEFTPLKSYGSKSPLNTQAVKGCIIAKATCMGDYKMSEASDLCYNVLYRTSRSRVRCDNLHNANDKIIYRFSKLSIYPHYNVADELAWANADGQKYKTRRDTFRSRPSQKYFHFGKGVVAYTSVMNNIAITTKMLGANQHESHHLQELVVSNTSNLKIDCIATDTEGSNKVNYVLLRGKKIEYAPCYKNLKRKARSLLGFYPASYYSDDKKYIIKPSEKAKIPLIIKEWEGVKPILAATWVNEIDQSIIVKKLCMQKRNSRVKDALFEYNNILRTRHILKYIGDDAYKGYIRLTLNRGEAYHQLRRKIAASHGGEFNGGSDTEINVWNECGRLIANAIIFYNAYLLSALMEQKEAEGDMEAAEFIRKLSPIACQHINFNGIFLFKSDEKGIDVDATLKLLDRILTSSVKN